MIGVSKIDELDFYYIPHNYEDSGNILNGLIKPRNAVEGLALAGGAAILIWLLVPVPSHSVSGLVIRAILFACISLPLLLIGCIGLGGEPLSRYVFHMARFLKNKRRLHFNWGWLHAKAKQ